MIDIRLERDEAANPVRLRVSGHAGKGAYGQDIVCAAASALVETLILGMSRVAPARAEWRVDEGLAEIWWPQGISAESRAVVETICLGLKDLAETEPKHVRWREGPAISGNK